MFKLESYITPILLSYVDKYIKNFRPEDSQVSLWGGDASFHNLDLRLEVLEQELQLPFSFVSGHIHELLIHVPWTKLASEPITITINTIECILKLRGTESSPSPETSHQLKDRQKKIVTKKQEIVAPPGYVQSLVNKIVSNIRIYCNNLILKYVEEDIVVSMNVKLLSFESANEKWEPAYTDISPAQITLRKLITVVDLTVCLDKRNSSGKIDVYQEPMLYRCSFSMHLLRHYHSATSKEASTTRLDMYSNCMEFSMTEQQVPMLIRIFKLFEALQNKELRPEADNSSETISITPETRESSEPQETWAGWAWSFVPSILPSSWDEEWNQEQQFAHKGHIMQIGFYVDNASITFKVSESQSDRGYYLQRKVKYWPLLQLNVQGIFMDCITHGIRWLQLNYGISEASLIPLGHCSCAYVDIPESSDVLEYFKSGSGSCYFKADSLFDAEAVENKGQKRQYNVSWDFHVATTTEAALLERSAAVAVELLYQLDVPDDMTSDKLSELGSDLEYSNLSEKSLLRIVIGPLKLQLCSGLLHRMNSLLVAASAYDYSPYSMPKPQPLLSELLPPSTEDFDALNESIPVRIMQITIFAPIIECELLNHPYFEPRKGHLFRKHKKLSPSQTSNLEKEELPKVTVECQCIDIRIQNPMYVKRLVQTTCQLPAPPIKMFEACHSDMKVKIMGLCSRLILPNNRHTTIVTPSSASYHLRTILIPQYWTNPDISHSEVTIESESINFTGTKAKLLILFKIIKSFMNPEIAEMNNSIFNSSLIRDASKDSGMVYMEVNIEGVRFRHVSTGTTVTVDGSVGSVKAFIYEPVEFLISQKDNVSRLSTYSDSLPNSNYYFRGSNNASIYIPRETQQVLFISGPELKDDQKNDPANRHLEDIPLFTITAQFPLSPEEQPHPSILIFNLQEIRICIDPLLCTWLLYSPQKKRRKSEYSTFDSTAHKTRTISEAAGNLLETPRKIGTPHESIHSSSDRDHYSIPPRVHKIKEIEIIDLQDLIYDKLKKWFGVWKGMLLHGDISQCTIYFPVGSLSAIGSQGIQQAVSEAMNQDIPPEILVITFPHCVVRSAARRQALSKYTSMLPIKLPDNMWSINKSSFPWTISVTDLSCYTLQFGQKLNFLKSMFLSATIGLSTKSNIPEIKNSSSELSGIVSATTISEYVKTSKSTENNSTHQESFSARSSFETSSIDIGSLGVCVHIDMSPICISTSEVQVCLIASIMYGLMEVMNTIIPELPKEVPKSPEVITSVPMYTPTISPTLVKESTLESISEHTPPITYAPDAIRNDSVKLTAWIQWTIARFTIKLMAYHSEDLNEENTIYNFKPQLKLVIDAEDIVSSLDFQNVYLKIKSKVAAATIQHFRRDKHSSAWKPGPFLGLVMRSRDDISIGEVQEETGFGSITITRASCQHTHSLWGAESSKLKENRDATNQLYNSMSASYITEIVVNLQPVDFVISLATLSSFYMVLEPLMQIPSQKLEQPENQHSFLLKLNNRNLPLAYLECHGVRIIMPSLELGGTGALHDVCMFQVMNISLNPSPINPICRTPCRIDVYQQAARARILNVPGSDLEDRQYQMDVLGMSVNTGTWEELDTILNVRPSTISRLRTMNENPALEWNNLEKGRLSITPHLNLWPVISKFNLSIIAAPAMVYQKDILICGHSIEVNFLSDIDINISLSQIKLASALLTEFLYLFEVFLGDELINKRPKIVLPYLRFDTTSCDVEEERDITELTRDSGFETSDLKSTISGKTKASTLGNSQYLKTYETEKLGIFPRPPNPMPQILHNIPVDILVAGGKISLALYQVDKSYNLSNIKPKEKKHKLLLREVDKDKGYEASEEGSIDEQFIPTVKKFHPLIFLSISQPNAFLSRMHLSRKIQLSCFDVNIKISGPEYVPLKGIPVENDFPINLLETRPGAPNLDTGIPPAFFTLRLLRAIGKPATLDIEIGKPTKILCSMTRWNYLIIIKDKVVESLQYSADDCQQSSISDNMSSQESISKRSMVDDYSGRHSGTRTVVVETYSKYKELKEKLHRISVISIKLAQLVFVIRTDSGPEVHISVSKISSHLTLSNRPERLTNVIVLDSLTVGVTKDNFTRLLLNPWTVSAEICLFWESWQNSNSDPQIQISGESDSIIVDISPEQIKCVEMVLKELAEFSSNFASSESNTSTAEYQGPLKIVSSDKEQHYKDDLRAGAFQFVDASANNTDELPLPYQVMFWNGSVSAMAWRYPQPRSLTKVRVFPVPFKITTANEHDQQVLCNLEYWSDCHGCYQPYVQFQLSESEMCHLLLPGGNPKSAVATTWRVVLSTPSHGTENDSGRRVLISPRALAACMRIDSYFNKALIPNITIALQISMINISLYSHFNKLAQISMPEPFKQYTCDLMVPENQCFLTVTLDNTRAYLATWNFDVAAFDITTTTKCSVLDYAFLTQQIFIEPFSSKLELSLCKNLSINFLSKPISLKFGPSVGHTLAVSAQMWEQSWQNKNSDDISELIIMTNYVICNDTNITLRFGQAATEEDILLPSRYCHLYSWRSQKYKQMIRVGLEENGWLWSKPFQIDKEGTEICHITAENNLTVLITVKNVSMSQKQITFSGQLIMCNMLLEHFELKVINAGAEDKDKEFKKSISHIINGKSTPPSIFMDSNKKYFLRLRFFGLESAWSGDIPLTENTKCAQPWLVKIPLQERGQFLSIWCRIVVQQFSKSTKILAMLWPLFMVRSNLPVNAKVYIETPTLNVHLESMVRGRGEFQQLYCPGTIDHSHQLTFQLDNGTPTSNPYVPLNYSLVDQKEFFKKSDKEDINTILCTINSYEVHKWPYFGDEMDTIDWIADEQPLTHVQVRYQNACEYSSALLVELLPWCLLINTLGCPVAVIVNERELCRVCHHGIVTPPKLEETFHIGVGIGGTWNMSSPLQLAKSDWSQTFYMPKITGNIPIEGNVKTAVKCGPYICMVSINSSIENEIRMLKVSSTHVLMNYMSMQLQVICFAILDGEDTYNIPQNVEKYAFAIAPHLDKSKAGISLIQWYAIGNDTISNGTDYVLYLSLSLNPKLGWSCPVRVDKSLIRKSIVVHSDELSIPIVITSQEHKGQIFLSLHHDLHPQLLIENRCGAMLFCAEFSENDTNVTVTECTHLKWMCSVEDEHSTYYTMPTVAERFPDVLQTKVPPSLVIAVDPEGDPQGFQWSTPISFNQNSDQYVRIPFFGDVKIILIHSIHTTFIIIESIMHAEISAKDIRVRLAMRENEPSDDEMRDHRINFDLGKTESSTTLASTYFSAADIRVSPSSSSVATSQHTSYGFKTLPTLIEQSHSNVLMVPSMLQKRWSELGLNKSIHSNFSFEGMKPWTSLKIITFIKSIAIIFTSDLEKGGIERTEVAKFTCDNILFTATQTEVTEICVRVSEIQFDNQVYHQGCYDFPVVMISQEPKSNHNNMSLNTPMSQWIKVGQNDPFLLLDINFETWRDLVCQRTVTEMRDVKIRIKPLSTFIEDTFIMELIEYFGLFTLTKLVLWSKTKEKLGYSLNSVLVGVPETLIWESTVLANPLTIRNLTIENLSLLLSVHSSIKLYLALDQSPLQFGRFERQHILTTPYRLGHALTMHYLSGAIFGAGWVVGSLELLGSPGGLARAMGTGLRDFVSLPYRGLVQGPWAFLKGITHGSASLMKHVTAGTLQSVTKLASSVARNLDRLTLDEEHLKRTEEQRRQRPQGLTQGFIQGLTGLGISLLGAVGGIAHHPLQSVMSDGASPRGLAAGVGLGLVGVITKPLSGAADLVALTGQGILQGAGWNPLPEPRTKPALYHMYSSTNSTLKYNWKFMQSVTQGNLLFVTDATCITNTGQYEAVALILTNDALIIVNTDEDVSQKMVSLSELNPISNNSDPTLLCFKLSTLAPSLKHQEEDLTEMDPACRARVANYVRNTVGLMQLPDDLNSDPSEMSVSDSPVPSESPNAPFNEQVTLSFFVNPQNRNYFLSLLSLAKEQHKNYSFPVL